MFRIAAFRPRVLVLILITAGMPGAAFAFAEDLCPGDSSGWTACNLQPCPPDEQNEACKAIAMLTTALAQKNSGPGSRSSVHFDATYYLAQAAGWSPRDAYVIAAYDEAVDLGRFILRGEDGTLPIDPSQCPEGSTGTPAVCALYSNTIGGTNRNDFAGGGVFFHFEPPPAGAAVPASDGLSPSDTNATTEPFLAHLHDWTYGSATLCVAGLTDGAGHCFKSSVHPTSTLLGYMPFVTETLVDQVDWTATIGEQTIATDPVTGANMPASQLGNYLPASAVPLARLAILVHALADRVSHHRCIDASSTVGPRGITALPVVVNPLVYSVYTQLAGIASLDDTLAFLDSLTQLVITPDYIVTFDSTHCDQPDHASRHTVETGTVQAQLATADQTTVPALSAVFAELLRSAQFYALPNAKTLSTSQQQTIIDTLVGALETADPTSRLQALDAVATQQHWLALPLYGGLDYPTWNQAAGASEFAAP